MSSRVTFVTTDPSWPARLAEHFYFLPAGTLPDLFTAGQVLAALQPNVILVDDRVANGVGPLEITRRLQAWAPHGRVVLLSGPATAGLDLPDVTILPHDLPIVDLGVALGLSSRASARSQVFMVTAMKGGVGKTTVALLLAAQLAQRQGRVVVWDCDFPQALVQQALRLPPELPTFWDFIQDPSAPLEAFVHPSDANIHVLPAPQRPDQVIVPDERLAREVVRDLCALFEYVIIDNDAEIQKNPLVVTAAQELASKIIALTDFESFSLASFRRLMVALAGLGVADRVVVVANDGRRSGERPDEIRRIMQELGLAQLPLFLIPHAAAIRQGQRTGRPPLLKEAEALANFLLEEAP